MYFFLIVLLIALTIGIILLLHRYQLKNRSDTIDRTTPLAAVDLHFTQEPEKPAPVQDTHGTPIADKQAAPSEPVLPASFIPKHGTPTPATGTASVSSEKPPLAAEQESDTDNWLNQVKRLRDESSLEAALILCRANYPRVQAFQQSGIILRQQIRDLIEIHRPVTTELKLLYRMAVLADLYRNSNPRKPKNPEHTLQALLAQDFDYQQIGTRQLRLLTKSDIRHLEQLWGRPAAHQHADIALGARWLELCA